MSFDRALVASSVVAGAVKPALSDPFAFIVVVGGLAMAIALLVAAHGIRRVELEQAPEQAREKPPEPPDAKPGETRSDIAAGSR
jgi:hypothetical protein